MTASRLPAYSFAIHVQSLQKKLQRFKTHKVGLDEHRQQPNTSQPYTVLLHCYFLLYSSWFVVSNKPTCAKQFVLYLTTMATRNQCAFSVKDVVL